VDGLHGDCARGDCTVAKAAVELLMAIKNFKELQEFALKDNVPWTLTHTQYANMGGFVIRHSLRGRLLLGPQIGIDTSGDQSNRADDFSNPTLQNMEIISRQPGRRNIITFQSPQFHLDASVIYKLRRDNILPKLPFVHNEELDDRSKSDGFVKAIAIVQISWVIMQIIVRTTKRLDVSQIELSVVSGFRSVRCHYIRTLLD
jgi:hypothetical protein